MRAQSAEVVFLHITAFANNLCFNPVLSSTMALATMPLSITFQNKTPNTPWDFYVYQDPPLIRPKGLVSVAWMVCRLSARTQQTEEFTMTYGVALTQRVGNKFQVTQNLPVKWEEKYEVAFASGTKAASIKTTNNITGDSGKGLIYVWNNTNTVLDIGVTLSGDLLLVQENVPGNCIAFFNVSSTLCISLCNNMEKGQVVPGIDVPDSPLCFQAELILGKVELQYPDGFTKAEVCAVLDSGRQTLQEPQFIE